MLKIDQSTGLKTSVLSIGIVKYSFISINSSCLVNILFYVGQLSFGTSLITVENVLDWYFYFISFSRKDDFATYILKILHRGTCSIVKVFEANHLNSEQLLTF